MDSIKLIEALSNAHGVSGFEDDVIKVVKANKGNLSMEVDTLMNAYLRTNKPQKPFTVMLDSHMDEVGFMVQHIDDKGLIHFIALGGWVAHNIPAHLVMIKNQNGKYIEGVVSSKPPHFMTQAERDAPLSIDHLTIDVGASSHDEVINDFNILPGAPIVPAVKFQYHTQIKIMRGKGFDNRLGCAAIIQTLSALEKKDLSVNVIGALAVQEEVGLRGATVTARTIKPDLAIVFEGTPADDIYACGFKAQSVLGKGPQIRHRDNSYIAHHRFIKFARDIANNKNIPFQDAVRASGGTNAGSIHLSNQGVPVLVLGTPSRYIHTHYSYASIMDFENKVKLATEIVKALTPDIIKELKNPFGKNL